MSTAAGLRRLGDLGLLLECPDIDEVHRAAAHLRTSAAAALAYEIVPGPRSVYVESRTAGSVDALARALMQIPEGEPVESGAGVVSIPVVYDGEDLPAVAELTGVSVAEVVRLHSRAQHRVEYFGFAPGMGFISGVPEGIRVPRRADPRVRVRANALAVANEFSAVYPGGTPGGWHLIGTVQGSPLWDLDRDPPNLLHIGDRVEFRAVR